MYELTDGATQSQHVVHVKGLKPFVELVVYDEPQLATP